MTEWLRSLESTDHEPNLTASSHSPAVNCCMQFVGRTLGLSLRRKKDFSATIKGHRQKIKENLTGSGLVDES